MNTDTEAYVYLMLANNLLHSLSPEMITVAEDVSGMPAMCRPVAEGILKKKLVSEQIRQGIIIPRRQGLNYMFRIPFVVLI